MGCIDYCIAFARLIIVIAIGGPDTVRSIPAFYIQLSHIIRKKKTKIVEAAFDSLSERVSERLETWSKEEYIKKEKNSNVSFARKIRFSVFICFRNSDRSIHK